MTSPLSLLTEAQELIRDPVHWTQEAYYRNAEGEPPQDDSPNFLDPKAVCFCSLGALNRMGVSYPLRTRALAVQLLQEVMGTTIPHFNDSRTHADVMLAFDRARKLAHEYDPAG